MEQKKVEIIKSALNVYMKYGIKSVTMDEMSSQLGVSKKTLYLYAKDKNDLVEQCLTLILDSNVCEMEKIFQKKLNAIEELLEVGRFIIKTLGSIHPAIFFDLAKFHPNVLKLINDHKEEMMCMSIENNLANGKKEGLYRENLTPAIVARFHMNSMEFIMSAAFMEDTNSRMDQVYAEFFRYHIRGIASEKGIECLKEIIQKDENL
jgi:AcrR family transcriptional regulator